MLRSSLSENREILCDGKIARHADLLTARDAHAVHATDHGFVAHEDGADHVVEQTHVLAVLFGPPRVVLRVFGGIATGAKRALARTGEDHRHRASIVRRTPHSQDDAFDHVGRVGIQLAGITLDNPSQLNSYTTMSVV